jgi:hypothetical protein
LWTLKINNVLVLCEVTSLKPSPYLVCCVVGTVAHLEVIVVAVGIDLVSSEYEPGPVVDSAKEKKKINGL